MLFFLWKGFLRHSFITKMLTKLKPQEQARKLEMFTHSKAYKNNPFPFSGQKCRELQQCTSSCLGTWGFADQKGAKPTQGTCRQQVLHYQCVIVWWLLTSDSYKQEILLINRASRMGKLHSSFWVLSLLWPQPLNLYGTAQIHFNYTMLFQPGLARKSL